MNGSTMTTGLEIAVIGKAGRFPGARDLADFWRNLREGVESISFFSAEELLAAGGDPAVLANPAYVPAYGALEGVELFDAELFGYSPREAEIMDPQQRVFLECAWAALDDAGYDPQRCRGAVGIYGGMSMSTYVIRLLSRPDLVPQLATQQGTIANLHDFLCTRVSYKLSLEGPSLTIQTACSTSLVAVHLACQALLSGECEMALAGGVSIRIPQQAGYIYREGGIASADGHCRAFDARASGTVGGAGVGIVVLKRLESALADGDSICAVIKGSAINNDGSAKPSYTAPRVDSQAKVIRAAQVLSEVDVETITYVETHGTATRVGDPIELAALSRAFRAGTAKRGFCAIGSVKSNIGHLDAAAGVAGLLKTVLALEHGALPPSLHFERPNPDFDLAGSPFYVNTKLTEWPQGPTARRASVSSFGAGGTNAHLILEEAPPPSPGSPSRPWQLLALSARTEAALEEATLRLARHLRSQPGLDLADVAYTSQVGRRQLAVRRALVCRSLDDAATALESGDRKRLLTASPGRAQRPVAFLFPGIGSHYVGMGRGLYRDEPEFRQQIDRCSQLVEPLLGCDLREVIYPEGDAEEADDGPQARFQPQRLDLRAMVRPRQGSPDEAEQRLHRTTLAQPALFVLEYALAQLWISWGIRPEALIGYSLGEYVAACLAGVLSLEDALTLVVRRAQMIDALPAGGMLAASLPESEIESYLGEDLSLAAVNGTSLCVVGGSLAGLSDLERRLAERGVQQRRLEISHPLHSRMLASTAGPFLELVRSFDLRPPSIPYVSNVSGTWIEASQATDPSYWLEHLCGTVRFAQGVSELWQEPGRVLLEVGPGRTLGQLALQQLGGRPGAEGIVLPSLRSAYERQQPDQALLLESLGRLWLAGVPVDWDAFHAHERRRRVPLPAYPFQPRRYWLEAGPLPGALAPIPEEPVPGGAAPHAAPAERPGTGVGIVEPRTAIERQLAAVWQELLGHEQVGVDDNFFTLGGDSLLAVTLASRLEAALGVKFSPHLLLEAPTVASMAELVAAALAGAVESTSASQRLRGSCLVEMQGGNGMARRPFYIVHPSGGQVYLYRDLAKALGPSQPVYGLRARGLEEGEEIHGSIEEMAAHYVEAVRSLQPAGPYLLGGGSMGGMIAFEMAQQLHAQAQEVGVVAMLDTPGPGQMPPRPADQAELLFQAYGAFPITLDELRRRSEEEQVSYILDAARAVDALPRGLSLDLACRLVQVDAALSQLAFEYRPRRYPGSLLFFRAEDRKRIAFSNPEAAWIDLAAAGIEIHVVPGDHISMHLSPQNEMLAARLRAALERVNGSR
jgi:phthiocerol/phenolphthiocerol synthesis type-I polyketide synthase E